MTTSSPATRQRGFTLVELLVVIGIMGVLLGLIMPAFTGLGRGANMRSAVMQLRSTIALARQWAITHREKTYVVFPDESLNFGGGGSASMARRAYAVYGEKSGYIREWAYLPAGLVFNPFTNRVSEYGTDSNFVNLLGGKTNAPAFDEFTAVQLPFPNPTSGNQNLFALGFMIDGRNANTDYQKYNVFIAEGWVDINTNNNTALPPTIKPASLAVGMECLPLTGQMKIREEI
jgi:prepilin-type N-terminal cleavage/methylation domain-containing protein